MMTVRSRSLKAALIASYSLPAWILALIESMISSGSLPSISLRLISLPSLSTPMGRLRDISCLTRLEARMLMRISFAILT